MSLLRYTALLSGADLQAKTAADATALSLTETATVALALTSADGAALTLSAGPGQLAVTIATADTLTAPLAETAAGFGQAQRDDALALGGVDQLSNTTHYAAADGLALGLNEGSGYAVATAASDAASLAIADVSSLKSNSLNSYKIPPSAVYVPNTQANRNNLQQLLDQYGEIRLDIGADYSSNTTTTQLLLRSYQGIYGSNRTRLPKVYVDNGTQDAVLSDCNCNGGVEFRVGGGGSAETSGVRIERTDTGVSINGANVNDCTFLGLYPNPVVANTVNGGYFRNNRIIYMVIQGRPAVPRYQGSASRPCYGNTLVYFNGLSAGIDYLEIIGYPEFNVAGMDTESWCYRCAEQTQGNVCASWCPNPGSITTRSNVTFRLMGWSGGQNVSSTPQKLFSIAGDFVMLGAQAGGGLGPSPQITYNNGSNRSALISTPEWGTADNVGGALRVEVYEGDSNHVVNGASVGGLLSSAAQDQFRALFLPARSGAAWERPSLLPPPDPLGSQWAAGRAAAASNGTAAQDRQYIQGRIDSGGITTIPAKRDSSGNVIPYYIDGPLYFGDSQGFQGEGMDQTIIVAVNDTIDCIRGRQQLDKASGFPGQTTRFYLSDVTFYGGANGIYHEPSGAGPSAQFNKCTFSNVCFRYQTSAGVFIDDIFSWDNNYIDHVYFVRCAVGFKQRTSVTPTGGDIKRECYLDKNLFYECQFIECGRGLDWMANRANNLNTFLNCRFERCGTYAGDLRNTVNLMLANTDVIDCGGSPTFRNNNKIHFASVKFSGGPNSATCVQSGSDLDGCVFERGSSTAMSILPANSTAFFVGCQSADTPMGGLQNGTVINSRFVESQFTGVGIKVSGGTATAFVSGTPDPQPLFLWGVNRTGLQQLTSADGAALSLAEAAAVVVPEAQASAADDLLLGLAEAAVVATDVATQAGADAALLSLAEIGRAHV